MTLHTQTRLSDIVIMFRPLAELAMQKERTCVGGAIRSYVLRDSLSRN